MLSVLWSSLPSESISSHLLDSLLIIQIELREFGLEDAKPPIDHHLIVVQSTHLLTALEQSGRL